MGAILRALVVDSHMVWTVWFRFDIAVRTLLAWRTLAKSLCSILRTAPISGVHHVPCERTERSARLLEQVLSENKSENKSKQTQEKCILEWRGSMLRYLLARDSPVMSSFTSAASKWFESPPRPSEPSAVADIPVVVDRNWKRDGAASAARTFEQVRPRGCDRAMRVRFRVCVVSSGAPCRAFGAWGCSSLPLL